MGLSAHGTTVSIDSTMIGGLTQISGPAEEKELIEVTDHDSGGDREYVPGLRDGGTLDLTVRLEAADDGQQALWASYGDASNTVSSFIVTPPQDPAISGDTFNLAFDGFVVSRGGEYPFDGAMEMTFSIKVSGAVTHSLVSV